MICLWGTLVGSLLPLMFKRLGIDPGIASSPFVATFVDVTGIVIYFSIAHVLLLSGRATSLHIDREDAVMRKIGR